jgi:hypothetical protein
MTHWGRWAAALLLSGCCLDGLNPPSTSTPLPPPSSPGTGTGPMLPGGPTSGLGTPISFGPGATDPTFAQGFGGGPIAGASLDPSCNGHYPNAPSHVLTLSAPLPSFRVMAFSARGTDLTLLVRLPNGTVYCNDDSDGLNPMVELTGNAPGDYQVYVGNYSAPGPEPYELAVSTSNSVTPTSMHFAPSSIVGSGVPVPSTADVGTLLLTGTATVTSSTSTLADLAVGTSCTYTQTRVVALGGPGVLDCRWQVTCGTTDVYGGTVGGYQPCADPAWSPATRAMDSATTATDQDPTFLFSGSTMTIGDDASGAHGAFTATLITSGS